MTERIIVSRHRGAVAWLAQQLEGVVSPSGLLVEFAAGEPVRVLAEVAPDNVRRKVVYGNLPLHLACLALEVHAIEFDGAPPRGQEYSSEDMERAGARLACYRVSPPILRTITVAESPHGHGWYVVYECKGGVWATLYLSQKGEWKEASSYWPDQAGAERAARAATPPGVGASIAVKPAVRCQKCGQTQDPSAIGRKHNLSVADDGQVGGRGPCGDAHVWA